MVSSDLLRGVNDIMILGLLRAGASYGYALSRRIREETDGGYEMKETTLYSALTRLEKGGRVESFFGEESFGKRRTYYRLTDAGEAYYRELCAQWQRAQAFVWPFIQGAEGARKEN